MAKLLYKIKKTLHLDKKHLFDGLYHEYSFFGINNKQPNNLFINNQKAKTPIITAHIALAIAKTKERKDNISFV